MVRQACYTNGFPVQNAPYNPGFVYCHVTDTVVNDIFRGTGKTYKETIRQIYKTQKPASFHTGKRAPHQNECYL